MLLATAEVCLPPMRYTATAHAAEDPDAACSSCHREIYEKYRSTPMAHASGVAMDGFTPGDFVHAASGIHYRVYEDRGRVYLSYERTSGNSVENLHGTQELAWFLGSGKRGRTYLFEQQGYWFEIPVNWYAKKGIWDMAPGYLDAKTMPMTLPADQGCLRCHFSGAQQALPDARNHYAALPVLHGGITCASCHGDGAEHVASGGAKAMLDPAKLAPERRDSVCLQCHLEGKVVVAKQGKSLGDFKPGDDIFDYALFFVRAAEQGAGGRATSQWEALEQSACKRGAGDRLICTTCHDPHSSPTEAERVASYRTRCLACHTGAKYATQHHAEQPDCAGCHMPRAATNDIAHEQVTDHRIQIPGARISPPPAQSGVLRAVHEEHPSDREFGLAYAQLATKGDREAAQKAYGLLHSAEQKHADADDEQLHMELGFLEQVMGHADAAQAEYRSALKANPFDAVAEGDLALILAQERHYDEAMALWQRAFEHDPAQTAAGENLAQVACGQGQIDLALKTLDRVLMFSPDDQYAKAMAAGMRSGAIACGSR
ncbi:tetratricopeptide repeat protein [Silvibacterium sp.]|uniref:tetratricopeptide repeat protein n=1 Tax=Silvibacterium sp. TaxID=1964179 RepID=UPI0039E508AC